MWRSSIGRISGPLISAIVIAVPSVASASLLTIDFLSADEQLFLSAPLGPDTVDRSSAFFPGITACWRSRWAMNPTT